MKKFLSLLLLVVVCLAIPVTAFAAEVGKPLVQPEEGWKRYDNLDKDIAYKGNGWANFQDPDRGRNNSGIKATNKENESVTIRFKGTKVRIIGENYLDQSSIVKFNVDGVSYSSVNTNNANRIYQVLTFELTGLSDGIHEVTMTNGESKFMVLDAVDIDENGKLIDANQPLNLAATGGDAQVSLNWRAVEGALGYNIKRSNNPGGPYVTIASSVTGTTYVDDSVSNGITYYYVVTSISSAGESIESNEASATPQSIDNPNRAILVVTMTTGLEKEFDLSMTEVNAFIDWYEAKSNGIGSAKFAIDKHNNNKGPFASRKDYVIFDKILTFEVSEYTTK